MDTVTGNKLIAEFDGWKQYREKRNKKSDRIWWAKEGITYDGEPAPHFENHWELLMPVVEKISTIHYGWEKIESPYDDCAYPRTFGMLNAEGKPMVRINGNQVHTADTLIEATWLSVVDFIQWHNNEQKIKEWKEKGGQPIL